MNPRPLPLKSDARSSGGLLFRSLTHSSFAFVSDFALRFSCFALLTSSLFAQSVPPLDGREGRNLLLENFRPRPMLQVEQHERARAKFPVVDVHTHFRHKFRGGADELAAWVALMDRNNIAVCVSLDGQWGELLGEHASLLWAQHKDRFAIFANID